MSTSTNTTKIIIDELRKITPTANLVIDEKLTLYLANTLSEQKNILCVVLIDATEQIQAILKLANELFFSVYPISTGHNWGYGCSLPIKDHCVILDLHQLTHITTIDAENGLFEIEPGVTQKMLRDYLDSAQLDYMIPTTGAGPNCSLIGNALERGYGLTPTTDHISALLSFQAILPTGELYQSPFKWLGCETISHYYRYDIGPYLDGLMAQSNFAIVTKATIALKKTPEHFEILYFSVKDKNKLSEMVQHIRYIMQHFAGTIMAMNLMNKERLRSTLKSKSRKSDNKFNILNLLLKNQDAEWVGFCGLYGNKKVIATIKKLLKTYLHKKVDKVFFLDSKKIDWLQKTTNTISFLRKKNELKENVEQLYAIKNLLLGRPNEMELQLAYDKFNCIPENGILNPSQHNIGLIWFAPIVPMVPANVETFVTLVNQTATKYNRPALITFSTMSDICFSSTIPIHFDKNDLNDVAQSKAYYVDLLHACHAAGFYPYRHSLISMASLTQQDNDYTDLIERIFSATDPNAVLSPGRYRKAK